MDEFQGMFTKGKANKMTPVGLKLQQRALRAVKEELPPPGGRHAGRRRGNEEENRGAEGGRDTEAGGQVLRAGQTPCGDRVVPRRSRSGWRAKRRPLRSPVGIWHRARVH